MSVAGQVGTHFNVPTPTFNYNKIGRLCFFRSNKCKMCGKPYDSDVNKNSNKVAIHTDIL